MRTVEEIHEAQRKCMRIITEEIGNVDRLKAAGTVLGVLDWVTVSSYGLSLLENAVAELESGLRGGA